MPLSVRESVMWMGYIRYKRVLAERESAKAKAQRDTQNQLKGRR